MKQSKEEVQRLATLVDLIDKLNTYSRQIAELGLASCEPELREEFGSVLIQLYAERVERIATETRELSDIVRFAGIYSKCYKEVSDMPPFDLYVKLKPEVDAQKLAACDEEKIKEAD